MTLTILILVDDILYLIKKKNAAIHAIFFQYELTLFLTNIYLLNLFTDN